MPFGNDPPDYVHLRSNESQMQLITISENSDIPTPSGSPCFNAPARDEAPSVIFIPGKKFQGTFRWWKSRTTMEKLLLPVLLLFCLLTAVLLAVIINTDKRIEAMKTDHATQTEHAGFGDPTENPTKTAEDPRVPPIVPEAPTSPEPEVTTSTEKPKEPEVCSTPGCVRAATHFLNAMNTSVDPCDDFFEFACGQWNDQHPIPDDMYGFGTFAYAREQVRQQLRVLLEQEVVTESESINMARATYRSCMNKTQLDELMTGPLFETLTELGEWPLLQENWDKTKFNFTSLLVNSRRDYGVDVFFQLYIYADSKNTSRNTLFIDQSTLALGRGTRDYYLNTTLFSSHMTAYRKYLRQIAHLLKTDGNLTRSESEMNADIEKIIDFEIELAKIIVAEDERRNNTRLYNKRQIQDLYNLLPQVDWVPFFQSIAPSDLTHLFHNETEIIICEIEYLQHVSELIEKTDVGLLTNYVLWRVVQSNVRYLDERFEDIKQDFLKVMTGQQQSPPRWKDCAQVPSTVLPLAAGAIYVQAHFQESDKHEALRMIMHLRNSFADLVRQNDWMDEETKAVAIEKANSMINNIGYPDVTNDLPKLDKQYLGLSISDSDTYYYIMKKSVVWMQSREFQKLTKPFDKHEFDISPAVVNAFYSPEKNAITFPAGILQPPFFSGTFPKAVNYGAIGAVIGHEITHGFDDQGSQYDKDGNLHNWWSESSLNSFDTRRRCIVEQYGNYTVPKTNFRVNGKLTQGENIADNGGVKEAFQAYQKYVTENGEEPRLPGLQQYTNEQIFFVSYAHVSCLPVLKFVVKLAKMNQSFTKNPSD
ncbi:Neprilysin-11 [Caenorhabditis elegans]|nr:Neprilysin-11 [Caenorhabditis elegans]CCD64734.1 Neprilysin-11 [Caenorhabditis elegans]|eukprot:NP_871928.1 Neprilysin-11 [Caenorhabditis elegans]